MRRLLLMLILLVPVLGFSQTLLTGKVIAASEPDGMPGVNIIVKGSSVGTVTNGTGNFSIQVNPGDVLVFSFISFKSQEVTYNGESTLTVTMVENPTELQEVVVVGYTSVEKKDITGSVTSISSKNFKDLSVSGIDQALQGQAAGVQVTQSSGTPGGGIVVRIRGATSISASNRPLFIVDGIAVETGSLSGRSFGGQSDNALALINPNDIESVQILKDASAKAIYGSRASNGVVIITTKRGTSSRTKITFDVQRGIIDPTNTLDLLNSSQLLELQRESVINAGQNPDVLGLIPDVTDGISTDWQDEVLRTGILSQYQLSASGGDENTAYYISATYRNEEGVQLNNEFERLSLTTNLDRKFTKKLSLSTNLTMSRGFNKRVKGDNFLDGVYSGAVKSLPYYTPYNENGTLIGPGSNLYPGFPNFNPVAQALLPRFDVTTIKVLGGLKATYKFQDNLILNGQVSVDYNDVTEDQYESSQTAIGGFLPSVGGQGYGVFIAQTFTNVVSNLTLSYNKKLTQKQSLNALVGTEVFQSFAYGGSTQGRLFPSDDFTYIGSAGIVDAGSSFKSPPGGLLSFFFDARYDYDDRILATLGFRADGSSNFGPNNKFGYFPAASVGWRISKEDFFNTDIITDLKVRASYGLTGNERIGAFNYLGTWSATTYNGSSGVSPNNVPNPNIKWETLVLDDAAFGLSYTYYSGTVEPLDFLATFVEFENGVLEPVADRESFEGQYTLANVNQWDDDDKGISTTQVVQTFEKVGSSWTNFSDIVIPDEGSRVTSQNLPNEPIKLNGIKSGRRLSHK